MKKGKYKKQYYTNEIDLSDTQSNFPIHQKSNDDEKEKDKFTIIGGRVSSSYFDALIRYIIPDYLIKAYENFQTIEILKELNINDYLNRIINTRDSSIFISEDIFREDNCEENLMIVNKSDEYFPLDSDRQSEKRVIKVSSVNL